MRGAVEIEAIRAAAAPLLPALPDAAWLPHALIRKPDGKLDKPPCEGATTNRPESWYTLGRALELLASRNNVAGIGFAITDGIIGLDYDDCRDPDTGELTDVVQAELEYFNSYSYVTPSGKGIRIVGINDRAHPIPGGKSVRFLPGGQRVEIFVGPTNFYNTFTAETIEGYDQVKNISDSTLTYLAELIDDGAGASGAPRGTAEPGAPTRSIEAIQAALDAIPNLAGDWDWWGSRIGMAVWRASGGSAEGLAAWIAWSARNPIHDEAACHERWEHWFRSPPTRIGYGSLVYEARQATPSFVPPADPPPFSVGGDAAGEGDPAGDDEAGTTGTGGSDGPKPGGLPLSYFADIHANLDTADFVEGLLVEGSMAVIYGESTAGKTFFMTDLCLHIAIGSEWRGRAIEAGGVIYCALEGAHGISNRVAAFRQHYALEGAAVPFAVIPTVIDMRSAKADVERLIEAIIMAREIMGCPVRLVVIDTLSRAMAGGNENAPEDMGALVTNTDKVRQATGVAVAYVHHTGKDAARGARGHSLLRAATDTEIEVSRLDKGAPSVALVTKQREMEAVGEFPFRLETVTLGFNRRGKPVTSCVVQPFGDVGGAGGTAKKQRPRLHSNAVLALRALSIAMDKSGAPLPPLPEYPMSTFAVQAPVWRREFYQLKGASTDTNKHSFSRAETELLAKNVITERNGFVWRVADD